MDYKALEYLTLPARSLRTYPNQYLFGPSGARLFADVVEPRAGFVGRFDLIHKMNIPLLFTTMPQDQDIRIQPMHITWTPHELSMSYDDDLVAFKEVKFITWEDQAVSCQTWQNKSKDRMAIRLALPPEATPLDDAMQSSCPFPCEIHGLRPVMCFKADDQWKDGVIWLDAGETKQWIFVAAIGLVGEEEKLREGIGNLLDAYPDAPTLCQHQKEFYSKWFDDAPDFECSDAYMQSCWWYRWYIMRVNLVDPKVGNYHQPLLYEGRSHRMDKTPYKSTGWEFSRLIPLSTPLQIMDGRWHQNREAFRGALRSLKDSADEQGAFCVMATDEITKEYAQYGAWALYQYVLCDGDMSLAKELLPAFMKDVEVVALRHQSHNDLLQVEETHALTGKEYQPGYWYFGGYPDKVRGTKEGYTPLKRVDRSIYLYLNLMGLSRLCALTGDECQGSQYANRAAILKQQILDKMWDAEDQCFYDLHAITDEKAKVRHITCFDPYWAEITEDAQISGIEAMMDDQLFRLGSALASTAADCPVFSPSGGWKGDYFKGRDGCMWNGPSWPYTTGIVLDGLAKMSKKHEHQWDEAFGEILMEYTKQHFRYGNLNDPYLVEFYNAKTGEALSDEPDYAHSYWTDLVVTHVAGIVPTETGFDFAPVKPSFRYFALTKLPFRGHLIDVYYQRRAWERYDAFGKGFTLRLDGKTIWQGETLTPKHFDLT